MGNRGRYGGDRLAITNNNHGPNRYSKVYLIEDHICKLSGCDSPWATIYCPLYFSATTTFWPKEIRKLQPFHDNNIQKNSLKLENILCHAYGRGKESGWGRGQGHPIPVENDREHDGAMSILLWSCCLFNSDAKFSLFFGSVLSWENELGWIAALCVEEVYRLVTQYGYLEPRINP